MKIEITLQKLTQKFIAQGYGRSRVSIDKATYANPLEDEGCTIAKAQTPPDSGTKDHE
jgi:hypothetical protein